MRTYLKIVNPAVAFVILALCFWAATYKESAFEIHGLVAGGMNTYFFAKGLFSASAVFMLGRILMQIPARRELDGSRMSPRNEVFYCFGLIGLVLSVLTGLLLHMEHSKPNRAQATEVSSKNPVEIQVAEQYIVDGAQPLRIGGTLRNNSSHDWVLVEVSAIVLVDRKFAARCAGRAIRMRPKSESPFTAVCSDFSIDRTRHVVTYEFEIEAKRKSDGYPG